MSIEERKLQSIEHSRVPDVQTVQSPEPKSEDITDQPESLVEDDEGSIKILKGEIQQIYQKAENSDEETTEKEQMAQAIKLLRKIDRKMADVDSKIQSRHKLFGGRFIQGSRLMQKGEVLLQERKTLATETFVGFLERYSLDPIPFLRAIERGGPIWKFADRLQENIKIIEELESTLPGACERLARDYGIRNFSRYPQRMLIEQLESEGDKDTPYGLALYSQNDWNNALNSTSHLDLEELDEETKKSGLESTNY